VPSHYEPRSVRKDSGIQSADSRALLGKCGG